MLAIAPVPRQTLGRGWEDRLWVYHGALSSSALSSNAICSKADVLVLLAVAGSVLCSSCWMRCARTRSLPPGCQALDGKSDVKCAQAGVKFSATSAQGFFHQPDHPEGPIWQNVLINSALLTWHLDLFSSHTQLVVSLVRTRMLNPHHHLY